MKYLGMIVCAALLASCGELSLTKIGAVTAVSTTPASEDSGQPRMCEVTYRVLSSPQTHIDRVYYRSSRDDRFRDCSLLRVGNRIQVIDSGVNTRIDWDNL